jgi:uncharacterized membrane protein YbhN (UPF0104 family)
LVRFGRRLLALPTPLLFTASVLFAVALLWRQGALGDLGRTARDADPTLTVAALLLYLGGLTLLCVRWHVLTRMVGGASDAARASEAFLTSVVVNYAAPIGLAVPTRAALTKRALGLSVAETAAVALWEVVCDVVVLALAVLFWILLAGPDLPALAEPITDHRLLALAAVVVAVGLLIGGVLLLRRRLGVRLGSGAAGIGLRAPTRQPGEAARAVGLTLGYWLLQGVILWLLLRALGETAGGLLILGLLSLPILVGMLSPLPGGAGVREALMVVVARVEEVDPAPVLLAAVTYRVALFLAIPILYVGVRFWLAFRRTPTVMKPDPHRGVAEEIR